MACKKDHSVLQEIMKTLPIDQGGWGRHKCAACAYEKGYEDGVNHVEQINLTVIMQNLEQSQAGAQRHKSPQAAYIRGYYDGLFASYHMFQTPGNDITTISDLK